MASSMADSRDCRARWSEWRVDRNDGSCGKVKDDWEECCLLVYSGTRVACSIELVAYLSCMKWL